MFKMIGAILISFVIIFVGAVVFIHEWNSTPTPTMTCKEQPPQNATTEDLTKAGCTIEK